MRACRFDTYGDARTRPIGARPRDHPRDRLPLGPTRLRAHPPNPAFYLPGQEYGTGNHRAFAALDPCRDDGDGCETGIDCCSGFCTDGMCVPPETCADTDEACTTSDDCCDPGDACLGGFCGYVVVQ